MGPGFADLFFFSWLIAAGAVVAAVLGTWALRGASFKRVAWWTAWGFLVAPWVCGLLADGSDFLESQMLNIFETWEPTLPTFLSPLVAIGLGVGRLRLHIRDYQRELAERQK